MATRLVFLCEVCLDLGTETSGARPIRLAVDSEKAIVDLCDEHERQVVEPVRRMLRDMGRDEPASAQRAPVSAPTRVPAAQLVTPMSKHYYPCAACLGTPRAPYTTSTGLGAHLLTAHGVSGPDVNRLIGHCRVRGCHKNNGQLAGSPQEIAQHVRAAHEYANLAVMLHELARTDPETVVDVIDRLLAPVVRDETDHMLTLLTER